MVELPQLTPIQYTTIQALFGGEMTTAELREKLAERGFPQSASVFSRIMARLSWGCLVEAEHRQERRGSDVWRQRYYSVTDYGVMAWKATRAFYADMDPPPDDLKPVPTETAELAYFSARKRKRIIHDRLAREFPDLLNRIKAR